MTNRASILSQMRGLCRADCPCIQLNDWRNQTITLTDLKEMEINGVRGDDYEIDMFKVILRSPAMLERVTFTFSLKSEQRIRRFSSKIRSILKGTSLCGVQNLSLFW